MFLLDQLLPHNTGDLNDTYFVGNVDEESRRLVQCTYECLEKAIAIGMHYDATIWYITYLSVGLGSSSKIYNCSMMDFDIGGSVICHAGYVRDPRKHSSSLLLLSSCVSYSFMLLIFIIF